MVSAAPQPVDTAWRSSNIGTLLLSASARVIATKLAVIHARGFDVTEAQLALFHAVDTPGTRLTALAARARLSKAAMAEIVDRAEAAGWVRRAVDRDDRRAKLVGLTEAGLALRAALDDGIGAAERETAGELGRAAAASLKHRLGRYVASRFHAADVEGEALSPALFIGGTGAVTATWAASNTARAVGLASQRFVTEVAMHVTGDGFAVSPALLGLIRHLDLDGTRLTEIAARARTTKQSMRELVTRAERLGYIVRLIDAGDGRARAITFTAHGRALLDAARRGVLTAESGMAAVIGATAFNAVKRDLGKLAAGRVALAA